MELPYDLWRNPRREGDGEMEEGEGEASKGFTVRVLVVRRKRYSIAHISPSLLVRVSEIETETERDKSE